MATAPPPPRQRKSIFRTKNFFAFTFTFRRAPPPPRRRKHTLGRMDFGRRYTLGRIGKYNGKFSTLYLPYHWLPRHQGVGGLCHVTSHHLISHNFSPLIIYGSIVCQKMPADVLYTMVPFAASNSSPFQSCG